MVLNRKYNKRPKGQTHDSNQERDFAARYPQFQYHPLVRIGYTLEAEYLPDFKLGVDPVTGFNVYLELKEFFTSDMVSKYRAVVESNNRMILLVIAKTIYQRDLNRLNAPCGGEIKRLFGYRGWSACPPDWLCRVHPAIQPNIGDEHED